MQLSNKKIFFLNAFLYSWNVAQILHILKKKMTLIADVFPKLCNSKDVFRQMS